MIVRKLAVGTKYAGKTFSLGSWLPACLRNPVFSSCNGWLSPGLLAREPACRNPFLCVYKTKAGRHFTLAGRLVL